MLPSSPTAALDPSLRAIGVALHARYLFEAIPELQDISRGLAWHITDRIPFPAPEWMGPPEPLLHVCLRTAFEAADAAIDRGQTDGRRVLEIYLRGLLYALDEVTNVRVKSPDGRVWNPLGEQPLVPWWPRGQEVSIAVIPPHDRIYYGTRTTIRTLLLSRICPPGIMAAMGRQVLRIVVAEPQPGSNR